MSEPRPRPAYGEYATPEEQRAARGLPAEQQVPAPQPMMHAPIPPAGSDAAAPLPKPRRLDRIATFALLGYGLITVFISGSSYLNIVPFMNEAMTMLGIDGTFTNYESGRRWGLMAAVVLAVGWTLTAILSVRRLRARKLTWWLPIVGGIVTTMLASLCLVIPMMGDPAFIDYVTEMTGR